MSDALAAGLPSCFNITLFIILSSFVLVIVRAFTRAFLYYSIAARARQCGFIAVFTTLTPFSAAPYGGLRLYVHVKVYSLL